ATEPFAVAPDGEEFPRQVQGCRHVADHRQPIDAGVVRQPCSDRLAAEIPELYAGVLQRRAGHEWQSGEAIGAALLEGLGDGAAEVAEWARGLSRDIHGVAEGDTVLVPLEPP